MNKYLATFITFITVTTIITVISPTAFAQYGQYGQYGQSAPVESILVEKQVSRPTTTTKGGVIQYDFVNNLTPSDVRFQPGQDIYFKVRIKNTSNTTLNNVMVIDRVPLYLEPIEGPGTFDSTSRIITFNAGIFNPDQERTFTFKMQWFSQNKLPADRGLLCATNYVRAYTDNASDEATSQACVEKIVVGVKQAPKAGPEMNILLIAGQLGMLGIGLGIKKKTKRII